jgi:hypothetical protein
MYIFSKWYKIYYSFINLKRKKKTKKDFFFYYFFFDNYRSIFLNGHKIYLYYKNINKLINTFFYKKMYYNIFFFNINKFYYKKNLLLFKLKKCLKSLSILIKIKVLIVLKNLFYIIILQYFYF